MTRDTVTRESVTPRRLLLSLVAFAFVLAACGGSDADTETAAAGGDFPMFTADTVGGGQLEFGSLEGQDAILWFWAPW